MVIPTSIRFGYQAFKAAHSVKCLLQCNKSCDRKLVTMLSGFIFDLDNLTLSAFIAIDNWIFVPVLKTFDITFDKGFVEQFFEPTINRNPIGFLCIFGIQYMIGKHLSFSFTSHLR